MRPALCIGWAVGCAICSIRPASGQSLSPSPASAPARSVHATSALDVPGAHSTVIQEGTGHRADAREAGTFSVTYQEQYGGGHVGVIEANHLAFLVYQGQCGTGNTARAEGGVPAEPGVVGQWQWGTGNEAVVAGVGARSEIAQVQDGADNRTTIRHAPGADDQYLQTWQHGERNAVDIRVEADRNTVRVEQGWPCACATDNRAALTQTSEANAAFVAQTGHANRATVAQR